MIKTSLCQESHNLKGFSRWLGFPYATEAASDDAACELHLSHNGPIDAIKQPHVEEHLSHNGPIDAIKQRYVEERLSHNGPIDTIKQRHVEQDSGRVVRHLSWRDYVTPQAFRCPPPQAAARPYYKYLPLVVFGCWTLLAFISQVVLPQCIDWANAFAESILMPTTESQVFTRLTFVAGVVVRILCVVVGRALICYRLWLGTKPAPAQAHKLTHVVVIPSYKEPMSVMQRTLASLTVQSFGSKKLHVVLAMEARDPDHDAMFKAMQKKFAGSFASLCKTVHKLEPGEIPGKSSNENHAVRCVFAKFACTHDPYRVMITICDVDSVFAPRFFEQLEWSFLQQPTPERLVFCGPLNTWGNFWDANVFIRQFEIDRCTHDMSRMWAFPRLTSFRAAQANYSLTLGFARDINYWMPDVTSEDLHASLCALVYNNGSASTVPIYSMICNDLVVGWSNRYAQAKRHGWGITHFAWALSLYWSVPFALWLRIFVIEFEQGVFQPTVPLALVLCFPGTYAFWFGLHGSARCLMMSMYIAYCLLHSLLRVAMAWFIWWKVLPFNLGQPPLSRREWCNLLLMCLASPITSIVGKVYFTFVPGLHALAQAFFEGEMTYVTAPKGPSVRGRKKQE